MTLNGFIPKGMTAKDEMLQKMLISDSDILIGNGLKTCFSRLVGLKYDSKAKHIQ